MHSIGVAEQVVHIAENFLICSHQEHAQIIWLIWLQSMHRNRWRHAVWRHEVSYLAVAVASHILDGGCVGWSLIKARNRDNREQLVDSPAVGQRLEQREIAEILLRQLLRHLAELFGGMLQARSHITHVASYCPEEFLNHGSCVQVEQSEAEEVESLLAYLQGIVPILHHARLVDFIPYFI